MKGTAETAGHPMREPKATGGDYYRSLNRKMVVSIIAVSFAPLILISGIIGYYFHTAYKDKVRAHLQELVKKHKQSIDSFLYERLTNIQLIARSFRFEQLSDNAFLQEKLSILREEYGGTFVDLGLVDDQGIQIAYAGPFGLKGAEYGGTEWFKKAMQSHLFISDVFLGLRRTPHFIITLKQRWGGGEWVLRTTIDFVAFNALVENTQIGRTGSAFILNRRGEFQTRPRSESSLDRAFLTELLAKEVVEGQVAAFERPDGTGREAIYMITPLKNGEWILVFQQDKDDALSELYRARVLSLAIFLVGGVGIVMTALFISRRMIGRMVQADSEKEMMNERVIEAGKLASVGELAAGIAHEINNPVAIMVEEAGWMEDLLQEEGIRESENLAEFSRALKQIKTQGRRCKEITHKLLSFARKTDPRAKEVQLNDLIREMVALSEQRARFSNVKLQTNLAPELPRILASPSEMQQVLLNLINNALDEMEKTGGSIEISTRAEVDKVVVDVTDTGGGIPQANLVRIFDPFFTTKPVGKGTGLGLSICYGIIDKMGGDITVNSAVGVGTTFHIHLPIAKRQEGLARPEAGGEIPAVERSEREGG
jgi:two-component system NtrC family sensor kinase